MNTDAESLTGSNTGYVGLAGAETPNRVIQGQTDSVLPIPPSTADSVTDPSIPEVSTATIAPIESNTTFTVQSSTAALPSRPLNKIASEYEAAVTDLDTFVKNPGTHFEAWMTANKARIQQEAATDYKATIAAKSDTVMTLEKELSAAGSWFKQKLTTLRIGL